MATNTPDEDLTELSQEDLLARAEYWRSRALEAEAETESALRAWPLRPVQEITAEEENFRTVSLAESWGINAVTTKRDPVKAEPEGTIVAMVFRIEGFDQDVDGSLMARYAAIDRDGQETGWHPHHLGLYPTSTLVVKSGNPADLWRD